jgi:hypothetical protein
VKEGKKEEKKEHRKHSAKKSAFKKQINNTVFIISDSSKNIFNFGLIQLVPLDSVHFWQTQPKTSGCDLMQFIISYHIAFSNFSVLEVLNAFDNDYL